MTRPVDKESRAEIYARSIAFQDSEAGNYILVDGEKLRLSKPEPQDGISSLVLIKAQYVDLVWVVKTAYLAGAGLLGHRAEEEI